MILREAMEKSRYRWQKDGKNLPEAILAIFKKTGVSIEDQATKCTFHELDLLAAVDHVFGHAD